jgi:hypothetical protein
LRAVAEVTAMLAVLRERFTCRLGLMRTTCGRDASRGSDVPGALIAAIGSCE